MQIQLSLCSLSMQACMHQATWAACSKTYRERVMHKDIFFLMIWVHCLNTQRAKNKRNLSCFPEIGQSMVAESGYESQLNVICPHLHLFTIIQFSAKHPIKKRKVQGSHDNRYPDCQFCATCSKQIQSKINKWGSIWNQGGVFGLHKWKLSCFFQNFQNPFSLS